MSTATNNLPKLSGDAAKKWRIARAMQAERVDGYTVTHKYKLDTSQLLLPDDEAILSAYKTLALTGPGSLCFYVATLHLLGFRLFGSAAAANRFYNRDVFDDGWSEYLQGLSECYCCDAESLIAWFSTSKRMDFDRESIKRRLYLEFTGKSFRVENAEEPIVEMAEIIAGRLIQQFDNWADFAAKPLAALQIADESFGAPQNISSLVDQYNAFKDKEISAPICFDQASSYVDPYSLCNEYLWQTVVALKLQQLRSDGIDVESFTAKKLSGLVKDVILTGNGNALSWLLNKGLDSLSALSTSELTNQLFESNGSDERASILRKVLHSIPKCDLFEGQWDVFRTKLVGFLGSAVSNYLNRLFEIRDLLTTIDTSWSLPTELFSDEAKPLFYNTGFDAAYCKTLLEQLYAQRTQLTPVLRSLFGGSHLPGEAEAVILKSFSEDISTLAGILAMVNNHIKQQLKRDHNDSEKIFYSNCQIEVPAWLKPLPRLNELNPEIEDPIEFQRTLSEDLLSSVDRLETIARGFVRWSEDNNSYSDPCLNIASSQCHAWKQSDRKEKTTPDISVGVCLDKLIRIARRCSAETASDIRDLIWVSKAVVSRRELNRAIDHDAIRYYQPPYGRRKIKAGRLHSSWDTKEYGRILHAVKGLIEKRVAGNVEVAIRDLLILRVEQAMFLLNGLPEVIPTEVLNSYMSEFTINRKFANELNQQQLPRGTLLAIVNSLCVQVFGHLGRLSNQHQVRRMVFNRTGINDVFCVAKPDKNYIPAHRPPAGAPDLVHQSANDALQILMKESRGIKVDSAPVNKLLAHIPHQWFIDLRLGVATNLSVSSVRLKKQAYSYTKTLRSPARLINKTQHINTLVNALHNPAVSVGDWSWIVEQQYNLSLSWDSENKVPTVKLEHLKTEHFVSIPFTYEVPAANDPTKLTHLVGIDLDQRGFGYAVKRVDDGEIIDSGWRSVESAHRLLNTVQAHRHKRMPKQNMGSRFSGYQANIREKVIGDYCQLIDEVCAAYDAWPIVENYFKSKSSGSRNLGVVFEEVSKRYTYSSIKTEQSEREHYWRGAKVWSTDFTELNKETGELKPFKLYPGRGQAPQRSSIICSSCQRNALNALYEAYSDHKKVTVGNKGLIKVRDGQLRLEMDFDINKTIADTAKEKKECRSRNETAPFVYTLDSGEHKFSLVKGLISNQLRRPDKSLQTRRGMFANFHCAYADCQHTASSAINAATNIVEKFAQRVVNTEQK